MPSLDTIAAGIAGVAEAVRRDLGGDPQMYFAGLSISGATALHDETRRPSALAVLDAAMDRLAAFESVESVVASWAG